MREVVYPEILAPEEIKPGKFYMCRSDKARVIIDAYAVTVHKLRQENRELHQALSDARRDLEREKEKEHHRDSKKTFRAKCRSIKIKAKTKKKLRKKVEDFERYTQGGFNFNYYSIIKEEIDLYDKS